jgi:hypothetical protein
MQSFIRAEQPISAQAHDMLGAFLEQKARLHEIPALVRQLSEREVMALALIENLQREDLNPVEEARAYHRLSEEEGMIQVEIAKMVEKSRSHVANMMRLMALPDPVRSALFVNLLTEDNLPYYFQTIDRMFGDDGVWREWSHRFSDFSNPPIFLIHADSYCGISYVLSVDLT